MRMLFATDSEFSLAISQRMRDMGHQTEITAQCDTCAGEHYDAVVYDAMPCLEDRYEDPKAYSHLLDFSDVVVGAYRFTTDHPGALHILLSSDEALYRDGGFYGRNRKIVEEIYYLCRRYLVVRCSEIVGERSCRLLDRLLDYRPIPYTPDTTLQFLGLQDGVRLVCECASKLTIPTVLVASGKGCVLVEDLCNMAKVRPVLSDHARKMCRDCDSSLADRMTGFRTSKEYAREYIVKRIAQDTVAG
jgi:hypothetical protein